jgi:hypothetical protein
LAAELTETSIIAVSQPASYGNMDAADKKMARKRKIRPFRAVTAVKELARERVGTPPAEKIVVEKKKKPEKHKPTLGKLLGEE